MTTIVTDGKLIAFDSQLTVGNQRMLYPRAKVVFMKGRLWGASGSPPPFKTVLKWWDAGCPRGVMPENNWSVLVVSKTGIQLATASEPFPDDVGVPMAIGSGSDYALGALRFGANAVEACAVACMLDSYSSGPVYAYDIQKTLRSRADRRPVEHEVDDVLEHVKLQYQVKKLSEIDWRDV